MQRRQFLLTIAGAQLASAQTAPESIRALKPMTSAMKPITDDERLARMEKARRLMRENRIAAIYLEPGTTMQYFTGVRWGRSERMFGMVLPARGEPAYVVPAFEEMRAKELIKFSQDIRVWQEDEDPAAKIARIFKDRGIATGNVGIEEQTRFFLFDGIRKAAPALSYQDARPVTAGAVCSSRPRKLNCFGSPTPLP